MAAFIGGLLAHHEKKANQDYIQKQHDMALALTQLHQAATDPGSMSSEQVQFWTDIASSGMNPEHKKMLKEHMTQVQTAHDLAQKQAQLKADQPQPLGMPTMPIESGPTSENEAQFEMPRNLGPAPTGLPQLPSPDSPAPLPTDPTAKASQLSTTGFNLPPVPFSPSPFWVDPQAARRRSQQQMQNQIGMLKGVGVTDPYALGTALMGGKELHAPPNDVMNMGPGSVAFNPKTGLPVYSNPGLPKDPKQITNEYEGLVEQNTREDGTVDWPKVNAQNQALLSARRTQPQATNEFEAILKKHTDPEGKVDYNGALKEHDALLRGRSASLQSRNAATEGIEIAAQSLASGDLTRLKDIASMRGGERLLIFKRARELNPKFSEAEIDRKIKMEDQFTNGKDGQSLQSFGTFLEHAGGASDAVQSIRTTNAVLANRPINWLRKNAFGDPSFQSFITSLEPVRKEFEGFLLGGRALQGDDRKQAETILSDNSSMAQIQAALKQMGHTAKARFNEMNHRYKKTMGKDIQDPFSPEAITGAQKIGVSLSANTDMPPTPSSGHVIEISGKHYRYNGSGNTADLKNYTEVR